MEAAAVNVTVSSKSIIRPTDRLVGSCLSTRVLLLRLLHALHEQYLELRADLLGLALEFVQELALPVINGAVSEKHLPQPVGFLSGDPAVPEDVILDGLVKKVLEGRSEVLHALMDFDE